MAKIVVVDGEKFISADEIISAMMKDIMGYVYGNDLVVSEAESDVFDVYERLLREIGDDHIRNKFREKYIMERFWQKRMLE